MTSSNKIGLLCTTIFTEMLIKEPWDKLQKIKTHGSELRGQYSRTHATINNDATTTCEYFTGRNLVQIQPSESLPSLTLSL